MSESILDLAFDDRGERVGELHNSLATLGYKIPDHEAKAKLFGHGTGESLRAFQRKSSLRVSGKVDKRTEIVLARSVTAAEDGKHLIEGRILLENGLPAKNITLRFKTHTLAPGKQRGKVKARELGSKIEFGSTKTDERGFFIFSFDPDKANNVEVVAEVKSGEKISLIPLSKTKYNLEPHEVLNLVAPASIQPLAPEYDRLFADLRKTIGDPKNLADAKENDERRDLTLIHQNTGWDARLIALAAMAEKRSAETKIPSNFLYALFRVGLPSDAERLCLLSDETIDKALQKAEQSGVAKLDAKGIARGKRVFARYARAKRLQTKTPGAVSTAGELLDSAGMDDPGERETFEALYFSHKGKAAELWQKATDEGVSDPSIAKLKAWRKLNQLTHDNARLTASLLEDIPTTNDLEKLLDLGLYEPGEWQSRLKALAGDDEQTLAALLPPAPDDETLEQRLVVYGKSLAFQVSESFRTQVIGSKVQKGELGRDLDEDPEARGLVGGFLRNAPRLGFRLGSTPIDAFVKRQGERLEDIGIDPSRVDAAIPHLKRLHRLYQITPSDGALQALDRNTRFDSAWQISAFDPAEFVARHGPLFPSEREALLVSFRSQQVASETLMYVTNARLAAQRPPVYVISGPSSVRDGDIARIANTNGNYPTIESLFGSVDYCECEHCRSMLSPAAYLVDLLQFLDPDDDVWGKSVPKPFEVLEGRRPDLPHLALTCENTHTALPYIDVVNEILEYVTAYGGLSGEAAHDTGEATTPELLAEPHNIERDAYELLRNPEEVKYPLDLPFDLWLETVRVFLEHFETPLWHVLEAFRTTDELFSGDAAHPTYDDSGDDSGYFFAAVLTEFLGLSTAEYEILCTSLPLSWRALYGDPDPTEDLHCARTLARRLDVSYKELADIVRTRFVNPELHQLRLLWRLRIDPSDALEYLHPSGSPEEQSAYKTAFECRIESVIAEIESDLNLQDVIDQIEAFDTPPAGKQYSSFQRTLVLQDTSAQCRFDQTFLRFADELPTTDNRYGLVFFKINLFVRLWKRLGWTIEETDQALFAFLPWRPEDLTEINLGVGMRVALVRLAHLKAVDEAVNLGKDSRQKLLTLWSDLPTTGPTSLYAKLFLTPSMQTIDPVFNDPLGQYLCFYDDDEEGFIPFKWDAADEALDDDRPNGEVALKHHLSALEAGLGLTAYEIGRILADAADHMSNAEEEVNAEEEEVQAVLEREPLTLANVSLLHRYGALAHGLGLSISELITLKSLSGLDPFRPISPSDPAALSDDDPTAQSRRFVEIAQQIKDSAFSVEDLDYLLRHRFDPVGKYGDTSAPPLSMLKALGSEIRSIRDEHAIPEDPASLTEDLLKQKLALALPPEVAETFMAMLLGTVEYEAIQTGVEEVNALRPELFENRPHIRISYDMARQEQRLILRGVLLDTDLPQLRDEVSSELFGALTAHHTQAKDFFVKHLQQEKLTEGRVYGFLAEGDFDTLFERPRPVTNELTPKVIAEIKESNKALLHQKLTLLANAFLPYLQASLIRQAIIKTLSTEFNADPFLTEALLLDTRLLGDPTSPDKQLLRAFEAAGERGVTAVCQSSSDSASSPCVVQTPDTRLLTPPNEEALAEAQFEGYLEVPANGAYLFSASFEPAAGQVELWFDGQPDPLLSNEAPAAAIVSPPVELKAGIPYRFKIAFHALDGAQAGLLIQGENLPKGPLSRLVLYPSAAVERLTRGRILLSKALQIIEGFGLGERELRYLLIHPEDFGDADLRLLPTMSESDPPTPSPLFKPLLRIADYASLRDEMGAGEGLIDVFEHARRDTGDAKTMNDGLYTFIADITRRDKTTVKAAAKHLGFGAPVENAPTYPLVASGFTRAQGIRRLWNILQICERLGVRVSDVVRWATPVPDFDTARDIKNTIKARYRPPDWQRVAQPIFDRLRRRKRDALVSHLMHTYPKGPDTHGFESLEELFEHFLIDPGMEPVVQTSRIQLAIASVQTFVQRCLLNLESEVSPAAIDREEWQWKKNYRVWEANRKIFLFPENWLEPEFRDDKTHLFQQLEGTLLQGDITNESAEAAFFDYLNGLAEIAKLDIVTSCFAQDPHDATAHLIHVIGRTPNTPYRYFYRQYSSNEIWTPWEPLTVEIDGDHVAAMVWKQRLHLFWITWVPETEETENPGTSFDEKGVGEKPTDELVDEASEYTRQIVKAQLNWSSYSQGKWSDPESGVLEESICMPVPEEGFDRKDFFIHVTKKPSSDSEETKEGAVLIHLNGNEFWNQKYEPSTDLEPYSMLRTAYQLFSRNSAPTDFSKSNAPAHPYLGVTAEATLHKGAVDLSLKSDEIGVDVEDADGTRRWNIRLLETLILGTGIDYSLQICAQGSDVGSRDPWYPLSPFFYQDDEHAFFVQPFAAAPVLNQSEEEEIAASSAKADEETQGMLEEAPADAGVVDVPPREPTGPFGVSSEAVYVVKDGTDWLVNAGMVLKFGDSLIGESGHLEPPGSVLDRSKRGGSPTVVGGAGLDRATVEDLRRALSTGHARSSGVLGNRRVPH